jgi:hypothetical protein
MLLASLFELAARPDGTEGERKEEKLAGMAVVSGSAGQSIPVWTMRGNQQGLEIRHQKIVYI